jgi:TonB family protein
VHRVRAGDAVRVPIKLGDVRPRYPDEAQARHIQGDVTLEIVVGTNGLVIAQKVVRSDDRLLNDAALEAVRQWRYVPTQIDGRPVEVIVTVHVRFTLP